MKLSDIYDGLLVRSGYLKALEDQNTIEAESRIENLMEFKSVIYDYEKEEPEITLAEFMERIALMADVDNHDSDENAVVLMTLHSAKGLEFPYVFMPGMEDGLFPGWRAFDAPDGLEEERRLCYVGITRAKERLWMTSAETRTMYGKTDFTRESQFLREIDRRIRFLNKRIESAQVVDVRGRPPTDQVFFGATVTYETEDGAEHTVRIVGIDEMDPDHGDVSWISPIARALLKAREGDEVRLPTPKGVLTIDIVEVKYTGEPPVKA